MKVTLASPDGGHPSETLPLPDSRYLAFHAAVTKVVHIAVMVEYLEKMLMENIRVLPLM